MALSGTDNDVFRAVFEQHPRAMWIHHAHDHRLLAVNDEAARLFGRERESLVGRTLPELGVAGAAPASPSSPIHETRWTIPLERGGVLEINATSRVLNLDGQPVILETAGVVNQRAAKRDAAESDVPRFTSAARDGVAWTVDCDGVILDVGSRIEEILGYSSGEMLGTRMFDYYFPESKEKVEAFFRRLVVSRSSWTHLMQRMMHRDGTARYVDTSAAPFYDPEGSIAGYRGIDHEITDLERNEATVPYRAYIDVLTGLPNRGLFLDRLNIAIAHAKRTGHGLAVFFIDLDRFKLVNDTFGHSIGDDVLKVVASVLRAMVRTEDTVDDFGTGYSSLVYLTRFPIQSVKIDRTFVHDIPDDHNDTTVVSAVLALAGTLGLRTVAEGVETRAQLEFLREHRCSEVQGFLLGVPMPAGEISENLEAGRWVVAAVDG